MSITADTEISIAVAIPIIIGMAALLWRIEYVRQLNLTGILELKYTIATTYATKDGVLQQSMQMVNELKGLRMDVREELDKLGGRLEKLQIRFEEDMKEMKEHPTRHA